MGLVLGEVVTPANNTERDGAKMLLGGVLGWFTWLRILWVDGGYTGENFANWVKGLRPKMPSRLSNAPTPPKASKSWRGGANLRLVDAPTTTRA